MTPPRLHVLTAAEAPAAVILRRGPSRQVATWLWDRATGTLTEGQGMRGRIFPLRSDLSPDGRHMVYHADTGRGGYRTILSRAPWLRALVQIPHADGWGGGGAFTGPGEVWLNGATLPPCAELRQSPDPAAYPPSTDGLHMGGTQVAKLVRRGWTHEGGTGYAARLSRPLPGGWTLTQHFRATMPVAARYGLRAPDGAERPTDWDWADLWDGTLQVTEAGRIARVTDIETGTTETLHDLTGPVFAPRKAPYEGARH
ncbi:hypothetical protein [Jannaschia formosa]|uniref:hypothetical protein n=1 Tax=Jannaschia formosa TaxID=2259592 RepID=UPI000E1B60FB|nr:hypothetical protein [Jannaschia formosa]TFL19873.1 hypothetical protein DR046_00555 [Jannaschia formosa]